MSEQSLMSRLIPVLVLVVEIQQDFHGFVMGKDAELVSVFDVHDLVADVVGGFDKIDKRMTDILQGRLV